MAILRDTFKMLKPKGLDKVANYVPSVGGMTKAIESPKTWAGGTSTNSIGTVPLNRLIGNFKELFGVHIPHVFAEAVTEILIDLLANSQPRVPVDTGELRRSGQANIVLDKSAIQVAKGNKDGTVTGMGGKIAPSRVEGAKTIEGVVSYFRLNELNEDIALWTHEHLLPYEARPAQPAARTEGTGPQYLRLAWLSRYHDYYNLLNSIVDGVVSNLGKLSNITGSVGNKRYTVDETKFVARDQKTFGYRL